MERMTVDHLRKQSALIRLIRSIRGQFPYISLAIALVFCADDTSAPGLRRASGSLDDTRDWRSGQRGSQWRTQLGHIRKQPVANLYDRISDWGIVRGLGQLTTQQANLKCGHACQRRIDL